MEERKKEMKTEQQNQILGCMNDVLNQNGFRAEIMQQEGAPTILRCEAMRQGQGREGRCDRGMLLSRCSLPDEKHGSAPVLRDAFSGRSRGAQGAAAPCLRLLQRLLCARRIRLFMSRRARSTSSNNTLVDGSLELDKIIPFVADNISVLLAAVSRFYRRPRAGRICRYDARCGH